VRLKKIDAELDVLILKRSTLAHLHLARRLRELRQAVAGLFDID
jgi:hypothetical protein